MPVPLPTLGFKPSKKSQAASPEAEAIKNRITDFAVRWEVKSVVASAQAAAAASRDGISTRATAGNRDALQAAARSFSQLTDHLHAQRALVHDKAEIRHHALQACAWRFLIPPLLEHSTGTSRRAAVEAVQRLAALLPVCIVQEACTQGLLRLLGVLPQAARHPNQEDVHLASGAAASLLALLPHWRLGALWAGWAAEAASTRLLGTLTSVLPATLQLPATSSSHGGTNGSSAAIAATAAKAVQPLLQLLLRALHVSQVSVLGPLQAAQVAEFVQQLGGWLALAAPLHNLPKPKGGAASRHQAAPATAVEVDITAPVRPLVAGVLQALGSSCVWRSCSPRAALVLMRGLGAVLGGSDRATAAAAADVLGHVAPWWPPALPACMCGSGRSKVEAVGSEQGLVHQAASVFGLGTGQSRHDSNGEGSSSSWGDTKALVARSLLTSLEQQLQQQDKDVAFLEADVHLACTILQPPAVPLGRAAEQSGQRRTSTISPSNWSEGTDAACTELLTVRGVALLLRACTVVAAAHGTLVNMSSEMSRPTEEQAWWAEGLPRDAPGRPHHTPTHINIPEGRMVVGGAWSQDTAGTLQHADGRVLVDGQVQAHAHAQLKCAEQQAPAHVLHPLPLTAWQLTRLLAARAPTTLQQVLSEACTTTGSAAGVLAAATSSVLFVCQALGPHHPALAGVPQSLMLSAALACTLSLRHTVTQLAALPSTPAAGLQVAEAVRMSVVLLEAANASEPLAVVLAHSDASLQAAACTEAVCRATSQLLTALLAMWGKPEGESGPSGPQPALPSTSVAQRQAGATEQLQPGLIMAAHTCINFLCNSGRSTGSSGPCFTGHVPAAGDAPALAQLHDSLQSVLIARTCTCVHCVWGAQDGAGEYGPQAHTVGCVWQQPCPVHSGWSLDHMPGSVQMHALCGRCGGACCQLDGQQPHHTSATTDSRPVTSTAAGATGGAAVGAGGELSSSDELVHVIGHSISLELACGAAVALRKLFGQVGVPDPHLGAALASHLPPPDTAGQLPHVMAGMRLMGDDLPPPHITFSWAAAANTSVTRPEGGHVVQPPPPPPQVTAHAVTLAGCQPLAAKAAAQAHMSGGAHQGHGLIVTLQQGVPAGAFTEVLRYLHTGMACTQPTSPLTAVTSCNTPGCVGVLGPLARSLGLTTLSDLIKGKAPPIGSVLPPAPPLAVPLLPGKLLALPPLHSERSTTKYDVTTVATAAADHELLSVVAATAQHEEPHSAQERTGHMLQGQGPAAHELAGDRAAHPQIMTRLQAVADWYAAAEGRVSGSALPRAVTMPRAQLPPFSDVLIACPPSSTAGASSGVVLLPAHRALLSAGGDEVLRAACSERWSWGSGGGDASGSGSMTSGSSSGPGELCTLPVITLPEATDAGVVWSVVSYAYTGRLCIPEVLHDTGKGYCSHCADADFAATSTGQPYHGGQAVATGTSTSPNPAPRSHCLHCFPCRAALRIARCADATLLSPLAQLCQALVRSAAPDLPVGCLLVLACDALWLGLAWAVEDCMAAVAHHVAAQGLRMHDLTHMPAWADLPQQLKSLCTSVVAAPVPLAPLPGPVGGMAGSSALRTLAQLQGQLPQLLAGL